MGGVGGRVGVAAWEGSRKGWAIPAAPRPPFKKGVAGRDCMSLPSMSGSAGLLLRVRASGTLRSALAINPVSIDRLSGDTTTASSEAVVFVNVRS